MLIRAPIVQAESIQRVGMRVQISLGATTPRIVSFHEAVHKLVR